MGGPLRARSARHSRAFPRPQRLRHSGLKTRLPTSEDQEQTSRLGATRAECRLPTPSGLLTRIENPKATLNAAGRAVKYHHFLVAGPMLGGDEVALGKEQDPLTNDLYKAGCAPPEPRPTPKRYRRALARWKKRSQSH